MRAIKILGLVVIGLSVAAYLGGYFFLWSLKLNPRTARP
jgi:hypothetical protein